MECRGGNLTLKTGSMLLAQTFLIDGSTFGLVYPVRFTSLSLSLLNARSSSKPTAPCSGLFLEFLALLSFVWNLSILWRQRHPVIKKCYILDRKILEFLRLLVFTRWRHSLSFRTAKNLINSEQISPLSTASALNSRHNTKSRRTTELKNRAHFIYGIAATKSDNFSDFNRTVAEFEEFHWYAMSGYSLSFFLIAAS